MNVGLLNLDELTKTPRGSSIVGGVFPNLAMMKVSQYHKRKGDNVTRYAKIAHSTGYYDRIYAFSVFTWSSKKQVTSDMICGGSGFDLCTVLPEEIENSQPDYSLYPKCKPALGFLTRGCIRKCEFCIVPEKEGKIHPYRDIEEVASRGEDVVLMDNNILACKYGLDQIQKIIDLHLRVDFNQGLDARLISRRVATEKKVVAISHILYSC